MGEDHTRAGYQEVEIAGTTLEAGFHDNHSTNQAVSRTMGGDTLGAIQYGDCDSTSRARLKGNCGFHLALSGVTHSGDCQLSSGEATKEALRRGQVTKNGGLLLTAMRGSHGGSGPFSPSQDWK